MLLNELKAAIRQQRGPVRIFFRIPGGAVVVNVEKKSLIDQLDRAHDGNKKAETGLLIREEDGCLTTTENPVPTSITQSLWEKMSEGLAENTDNDQDE